MDPTPLRSPVAGRLSRRRLLTAAGIGAGVTAVTATALSTGGTGGTSGTGGTGDVGANGEPTPRAGEVPGLDPTDIDFAEVKRFRQRDLVGAGFVTLEETFDHPAADYDVLAPDGRQGTVVRRQGRLGLGGAPHFTLLRSDTGQVAPYAAVVLSIAAFSGDPTQDMVLAGLVRDRDSYVAAWFDRATGTAGIDVCVDGEVRTLGTADVGTLTAPCRVAFALTSTTVVAFVDEGGEGGAGGAGGDGGGDDDSGFRPVLQERLDDLVDLVDLRRPAELAAYRNGFGARSGSGVTELAGVRAGYFGQLGLRDPHLVTHADGRPYIRDNQAYVTFTQAGLAFFETAHWGVWTVDLDSYELAQVANLFFRREGLGMVLGDHAGHLVRDDRNHRWIVATSTWGSFTYERVEVTWTTVPTDVDVLHGVHVLDTERLPLPLAELTDAHVGQWDPHIVRIGDRWYVAFVNAREFFSFFPALSRSPRGADLTELRLVGADYSKVETEGTVMQKLGSRWFLMASNGDRSPARSRGQYPVYDLGMAQVGTLDAPHPTNIPWPMAFPVPTADGRARWVLLTFDGTPLDEDLLGYGTHGDVIVMEGRRRTDDPF